MRRPPERWSFHYRRSLTSRIIVLTTMAVGISVAAVAFAAYATVRSQSIHALDDSLHDRANQAAASDTLEALSRQSIPPWALGAADVKIVFLDADNHSVRGSAAGADAIGSPEFAVALGTARWSARTTVIDGVRYRMVAVPADADGEALIIAQSLAPTDRMLARLGLVTLLFGLAGIIIAGLAGWVVASNGLRPVRRLTAAVEKTARTERLAPIEVEGNDEVARLSVAFNTLLQAVSASQQRQRQLVADAGHELRTPLTSLRTNLDLLVQADASSALPAAARKELLDDVRNQITELSTLVGDLIELARDEPGAQGTVEPVDLAAIVEQAVARVRRRAPGLRFDVAVEPWWLEGDASALERAVTNLLDNAAKWSPDGGTVRVRLHEGTVEVTDDGSGIAEADLPHVFERFYRSEESRTMPGSGLGLSIVSTVADRHGGTVSADNAEHAGARLRLSVPGAGVPPEVLAGS